MAVSAYIVKGWFEGRVQGVTLTCKFPRSQSDWASVGCAEHNL